MTETEIHPLAFVEKGATIGRGVVIEPFAVIKANVIVQDHVTIKSHAYIDGYTTIHEGTTIWPFASIGTKTQDLKFKGEKTYISIGKRCDIRESVTINASTQEGSTVQIGDDCLIMAYCHVAHNCIVGNHVIMSNNATLAGHVEVGDYAVISGMTGVHQFCRIGTHAMVGGFSRIVQDVPPYTIGAGIPYKMGGLNLIGLKRRNVSFDVRRLLSRAFRIVYRSGLSLNEALEKIIKELPQIPEIKEWVAFCQTSKRGLVACTVSKGKEEELE